LSTIHPSPAPPMAISRSDAHHSFLKASAVSIGTTTITHVKKGKI
jgi:hypothetical protein